MIRYVSPLFWPGVVLIASAASVGWQTHDALRLAESLERVRSAVVADSAGLEEARERANRIADTLSTLLHVRASRDSAAARPMIVVSIADNRLWYRRGSEVLFETRVATGSGKHLDREDGDEWRFETPRGRLVVQRKDVEPPWVPPDWHFAELAAERSLRLVRLARGASLPAGAGAVVTLSGADVVTRYPDGREVPFEVRDGTEIRVGGDLVVPPLGTNQRRYAGVLGSHRLYIGSGYGIHGTNSPSSIGRSVSHGCIRLRNEDIEVLFRIVSVGTPVYVY